MSPYVLGVLPGEGIGPEVIAASLLVLDAVGTAHGLALDVRPAPDLGPPGRYGSTMRTDMDAFFAATFAASGAVLCGPISGRFVYELRARFALFCKFTPVRPSPALTDVSIVRAERLAGIDVLIVRENTAGLYQGEFGRRDHGRTAYQHLTYSAEHIDRVLGVAAHAARLRRGRLAVVTKRGGIPEVSALWRERAALLAAEQGVAVEEVEVDNACFQVVARPQRFDVIVAPNMLGDIVGDAATLVLGSRGMSLSANFGEGGLAVYQTAHGAAYDLAASDRANPVAQILSLAMLLRESFGLTDAARSVELAVERVLSSGFRTEDIAGPRSTVLGTRALADRIAEVVHQQPAGLVAG
jgi:3-isopropylmalate dehydrogenase